MKVRESGVDFIENDKIDKPVIYIQSFILFETDKLIPTPHAFLSVIKTALALNY